jgi:hypothetical protein
MANTVRPATAPAPKTDYTISQFDTTQYHQAYGVLAAICGPNVAEAFEKYYGMTTFTPDQIVALAKDGGLWTEANGMNGPAAEKSLLDRMGIPVQYSPTIQLNDLISKVQSGSMAAVSTPGHYFFIQGYDPATGLFDTGQTGSIFRQGGNRYLSWDDIQRLGGGAVNGAFVSSGTPGTLTPSNTAGGSTGFNVDPNDVNSVTNYIRQAAVARGIDPDIAVRVAESEGLSTYVGDSNSSFGPFQLHYGGIASGGNAVAGMGDAFTKATGLDARDPSTIKAQIDFSLDQAAQYGWGQWHGAARIGLKPFDGIGANAKAIGSTGSASANPNSAAPPKEDPWFTSFKQYASGMLPGFPQIQSNISAPSMSNFNPSLRSSFPTGFSALPQTSQISSIPMSSPSDFTPLSIAKSPYAAPNASPNFMSLMSRPGSLYG